VKYPSRGRGKKYGREGKSERGLINKHSVVKTIKIFLVPLPH